MTSITQQTGARDAALDEAGRAGLRRELERLWDEHNEAGDGTTRVQSEYLEVIAVVD